jgi:hypothetical protein
LKKPEGTSPGGGNAGTTAVLAVVSGWKLGNHMDMTTTAQTTANRLNAVRSTGPKTPEGRAASATNALKHGLRANSAALLPSESHSEWEVLLTGLRNEWQPETVTEALLVERMAAAEWKRRRSEVFEVGGLEFAGATERDGVRMAFVRDCNNGQTVSVVIRYRRAAEAAFISAKHELERAQARRRLPPGTTLPPPLALDVVVTAMDVSDPEE